MNTPAEIYHALPPWARGIVDQVAAERLLPRNDILGGSTRTDLARARHEVWARVKADKPALSSKRMEMMFGHESSTIRHALRNHRRGQPRNQASPASRPAAQ